MTVEQPQVRQDGFGSRRVEQVKELGFVERLVLSPDLSTPGSEQAIRARAAHLMRLAPGPIGRVLRVERKAATVSMVSEWPDGVSLSDILAALEFGTLTLSDDELVELSMSVVRSAATMHQRLGTLAHGALSPAHIVVGRDGATVLTGAVFGDAIQALKLNRHRIWRQFGLVFPAAAAQPRFDQRSDVTQLGGLVLAISLRRSLRRDEFPDRLGDLVSSVAIAPTMQVNSRLRSWLQDALQLHGRVVFDSCIDAAARFGRMLPRGEHDEASALALRTAILQLCGTPMEPRRLDEQSRWGRLTAAS